jgi:cysteine desulfuration protein SufE
MNSMATTSAEQAQQQITEEFAFFGDWTERYQYLIDLGKQLPEFPEAHKSEDYRVHGCQSMVWLTPSGDASNMHFEAASDSAIVSGLIALVLRVYSDRPAAEILATEPSFIGTIGLAKHLSPTRSNGLAAMLIKLKAYAARAASTG